MRSGSNFAARDCRTVIGRNRHCREPRGKPLKSDPTTVVELGPERVERSKKKPVAIPRDDVS